MTEQDRPNVLVILADQLRRDALRVYGDPNAVTPHIDALAASGVRFSAACSTYPICVPARYTLMTGQYAHSRFVPSIEWRMSPSERTLADEFNDAGYGTVYVGKWHLYGGHSLLPGHTTVKANRTPVPRQHQGRWQKWLGFELCNAPFDTAYFVDDDPEPRLIDGYQTDGLFDLAMDHLANGHDPERPFCCVVSVEPPHPLFTAPDAYMHRWKNRDLILRPNVQIPEDYTPRGPDSSDLLDDMRAYYAMVENLDDNVGRIVQFLRDRQLDENTIIVVLSDHGELMGSHGLKAKQYPYEESVGIPLIIADPRTPRLHGTEFRDPVNMEDIFPTLLGLANVPHQQELPGTDVTPLIHGERDALDRDGVLLEFVAEFRPGLPFAAETWRAFRSRRYKYTVLGDAKGGEPWQFFDLDDDPYEMHNRIDDPHYAGEIRRHHRLLRDKMTATGDHYVLQPAFGMDGLNEWHWPPGTPAGVG